MRELLVRVIESAEDFALSGARRFNLASRAVSEKGCLKMGRWRARAAAQQAWHTVPAYRDFLAKLGLTTPDISFEHLPVMSKDSYVRAYPTEQRCVKGRYLFPGVAIDESSGSTGIPYNWVRGAEERRRTHRTLARLIDWSLGQRPRIAINAFSMGAWATGVNMGEALSLHSVVKSTGPDLEKVLHTLEFFGPKPGYFICGYPPFLKLVLDSMLERNFPIGQYELHAMVGGEGMSENFRRHLLRHFRSCISGYGASDLEMGIAVETPESIQIRGLLNDHLDLRQTLLEGDHRCPMVFQYDPMTHWLETNSQGELIATLTYSRTLSPRIRYNIGDEARLFTRGDLLKRLHGLGCSIQLPKPKTLPLPYLFLFGRRDQTISIMGANIYPEDVEQAIFAQPELAAGFAAFLISVEDRGDGSVYPRVSIEWTTAAPPDLPLAALADRIGQELAKINSDFRSALKEYSDPLRLEIALHGFGQGPFAGRDRRIKNRYLEKKNP